MTIHEYIAAQRITMTAEPAEDNPNMDRNSRDNMDHWTCRFRMGRKRLTVPFSMGVGLNGKTPEAAEVLNCLASDANSADELFETWANEYGYDTDSREAERTFNAVRRSTKKLRAFLGSMAAFDSLVGCERL